MCCISRPGCKMRQRRKPASSGWLEERRGEGSGRRVMEYRIQRKYTEQEGATKMYVSRKPLPKTALLH